MALYMSFLLQVPPIYELDTTDLTQWNKNVSNKAIEIIENHLNGSSSRYEPIRTEIEEEKKNIDGNSRNYCAVCDRLIIGDKTYKIHLNSNRHMKVVKIKRKLEKQEAAVAGDKQQ